MPCQHGHWHTPLCPTCNPALPAVAGRPFAPVIAALKKTAAEIKKAAAMLKEAAVDLAQIAADVEYSCDFRGHELEPECRGDGARCCRRCRRFVSV